MNSPLHQPQEGITLYEFVQKTKRDKLIKAKVHYFRSLFKKSFKSIQNFKTNCVLSFWFKILKRKYIETKCKYDLLSEYNQRQFAKSLFTKWKNKTNLSIRIGDAFLYLEDVKAKLGIEKAFTLIKRDLKLERIFKQYSYEKRLLKKRNYLEIWKYYIKLCRSNKIAQGQAYEAHYIMLMKKVFRGWSLGCFRLREEERKLDLKAKCLRGWQWVVK